jgi:hypothetical protein
MTSSKRFVRFRGIVRGNGVEAECVVRALEVRLLGTDAIAYTQYRVEDVSKPLPDGLYDIIVNGETQKVRYQNGHWLAAV